MWAEQSTGRNLYNNAETYSCKFNYFLLDKNFASCLGLLLVLLYMLIPFLIWTWYIHTVETFSPLSSYIFDCFSLCCLLPLFCLFVRPIISPLFWHIGRRPCQPISPLAIMFVPCFVVVLRCLRGQWPLHNSLGGFFMALSGILGSF